jgi:hypothetical protein
VRINDQPDLALLVSDVRPHMASSPPTGSAAPTVDQPASGAPGARW